MTDEYITGHFDDAWIQIDQSENSKFFIRFLDATRSQQVEFARKNPEVAFAHLDLQPGMSVLDCGCGTGDMLGLIAGITAPGKAVGGDLSAVMINEARRRAEQSHAENLNFEIMDVLSLPFEDNSFDRVLATQLLIHVPDPRRAMAELCRVTAPGGLVVLLDMDWDAMAFGCSNKELGRRFTHSFTDGLRNGFVVREYPGWLHEEGFEDIQTIPQTLTGGDFEFGRKWMIMPSLTHFVAQGDFTQDEADAFIEDLEDRNATNSSFSSMTTYTIIGRKP